MKFNIDTIATKTQRNGYLIIAVFDNGELSETGKKINAESNFALSKFIKDVGFQGKVGYYLPLFNFQHKYYQNLLLIGCGKKTVSSLCYRKIIYGAAKALFSLQVKQAFSSLTEIEVKDKDEAWKVRQTVEAVWDAAYRFEFFKSEKERPIAVQTFTILIENERAIQACKMAIQQGVAIGKGVTLAKNLGNMPSNICTPTFLLDQAKDLAKQHTNVKVKSLDEDQMRELGMGALLAVAQGSAEEARLIILEYNGGKKNTQPIALIGKGITFDTGGNSLKTPDNMIGMKYDMCGGATVLGVFLAAALLKLPINIVGLIAAVENMPGGTAYKPEDILTSLSGQTIEVLSTDAEGRLVLADAMTYCQRYNPELMIDIATLTGAVVIALGKEASGLISNDEGLANALLMAGTESNDRAWQLPLWDEYQEQIKSIFADMTNTGGRAAGAILAGCFLSRFAKNTPWAHLDIAGSAGMGMSALDRSASGRPVPLLMQFLLNKTQDINNKNKMPKTRGSRAK